MTIELVVAPQHLPKQNVVGVGIRNTSYESLVESCRDWIVCRLNSTPARTSYITVVASMRGIILSRKDEEVLAALPLRATALSPVVDDSAAWPRKIVTLLELTVPSRRSPA